MNFKNFFLLFSVIIATTHAQDPELGDITQEFCKVTNTPDTICAQFQAFKRKLTPARTEVELFKKVVKTPNSLELEPSEPERQKIGYVEYTKTKDNVIRVEWLKVNDDFQGNNYGSKLLLYALAQCNNCPYTTLMASPFTARSDSRPEKYQKLKQFYASHGGKVLYEGSEHWDESKPTYARMYFSENF